MRRSLKLLLTVSALSSVYGCAHISIDHTPVFHTPLVDTVPPEERRTVFHDRMPALSPFRRSAVQFAKSLDAGAPGSGDYGEVDVESLFAHVHIRGDWDGKQGIAALARWGRRQKAYAADGHPLPGDIVLFHNQRDMNGNGKIDDWLTGCGIVLETDRDHFEAAIRTGGAPRRIIVTPLVPSARERDGKIINSFVRIPTRTDPEGTEYLAGQLYAGHIDIERLPLR